SRAGTLRATPAGGSSPTLLDFDVPYDDILRAAAKRVNHQMIDYGAEGRVESASETDRLRQAPTGTQRGQCICIRTTWPWCIRLTFRPPAPPSRRCRCSGEAH